MDSVQGELQGPCGMGLQQDRAGPPREPGRLTLQPQGDQRGVSLREACSVRESSLPKKARRPSFALLPPLLTHSAFRDRNSVPGHHDNQWPDTVPKARPICPPSRELFPQKKGRPATTPSGLEV